MYQIITDDINGTIKIYGTFSISGTGSEATPYFNNKGDEFIQSFVDMDNVLLFKKFSFDSMGSNPSRYLSVTYRVSRNTTTWTPWQPLNSYINNFPPFNPKDTMYLDIKFTRDGISDIGTIRLLDYQLEGSLDRETETGDTKVIVTPGSETVIKPPYIYKVFKIDSFEIISTGASMSDVNIQYRYSQDYGRTVSKWTPLTVENLSSERINPIRFFQIEYLVKNNNISSNYNLYDLNLIGDFQNVTLDSTKSNLLGVRENCNCILLGIVNGQLVGTASSITSINDVIGPATITTGACSNSPNQLYQLTDEDKAKLFNPYDQAQAQALLNKISNDAVQIFGFDVVYFITDPDKKGIDHTFHEYQLYNYVCDEMIKIAVDGNNFPDNQIVMNQFDLSLFDTFEVHITKQDFKAKFGVEKRPSKEDFLWFCELNRMFQVEHAQQYRNFNNSSIYYKVMLKKYVQKANIIPINQEMGSKVRELTKNSTIDELFGLENMQDKKAVSNKEQFKVLTKDMLRVEILASIDKELIENSTDIISKTHYDLNSVGYQNDAVVYRNFKNYFKKSDNISYYCWFNINNYTVNDVYNIFKYYDNDTSLGMEINLEDDNIKLNLNTDEYNFQLISTGDSLFEETWYCYLINIDQRQRSLSQYIYKRDVDDEEDASKLNSTKLRLVHSNTQDMTPVEFELPDETHARILGSDMKITNIRMFIDVIPESEHNKILNQSIIRDDSAYLIFADNCNQRLVLPNYELNQGTVDDNLRAGTRKNI